VPVKKKTTINEGNQEGEVAIVKKSTAAGAEKVTKKREAKASVSKKAEPKTAVSKKAEPKAAVSKKAETESAKPESKTKKTTVKKISSDESELKCIADAILDKRGNFVCSLDLRPIGTAICDYFVVCNADSGTQVNAIADNVEEMMIKNCGRKVIRMQGKENAFWIILDYGNIVVHVFQTEYRQFYRLEDLWADAERTVYQD
jgi:ribosome-associated protein